MKPLTLEWIAKAEGDFVIVKREMRARKSPNYDAVCFHAQQCAEKYLKARLQEASIAFTKTHDLLALLNLVLPVEPGWSSLTSQLTDLTEYAVRYRYPGDSADRLEALKAARMCREVRHEARRSLGLPV